MVEDRAMDSWMEEILPLDMTLFIHRMVLPLSVHVPLPTMVLVDKLKLNANNIYDFNFAAKSLVVMWNCLSYIL